jgi:hypothetical protein
MKTSFPSLRWRWLSALALLAVTLTPAAAQEVLVGLAPKNRLVYFTNTDPGSVDVVKITGLAKKEKILGIDRRPATGQLYALGSSSRVYVIDPESGAATAVGSGPFTPALSGTRFGFDFNPVVDRIRIVSNTGQNLRVHPDTGVIAATDLTIAYATGDDGEGTVPSVSGSAYTNSVSPAPVATTLYDIESKRDVLVTQNPPNNGTLNTVGPLGVNVTEVAGFDIAQNGAAYGSFQLKLKFGKSGRASLFTINLETGAATLVGKIGGPYPISAITALGPIPE